MDRKLLNFVNGIGELAPEVIKANLFTHISEEDPYYFIHAVASNDMLCKIPKDLLTEDVLSFENGDGWTAVHYAAQVNGLEEVPNLTDKLLGLQTNDGQTPLHIVASLWVQDLRFVLDRFPPSRPLVEKAMLLKDEFGYTVLHTAVCSALEAGSKEDIADILPVGCFTPKTLMATDYCFSEDELRGAVDLTKGECPLQLIAQHYPSFVGNFIGMNLPERARSILGDEWWDAHLALLKEPTPATPDFDVDMF